jgi:hypothetical protein
LKASTADVVYLVEHDVLYHPSHFDFIPSDPSNFYYNQNVWQVDAETGQALFRKSKRTSQLVTYRDTLIKYFEELFKVIEKRKPGHKTLMGIAPMTHKIAEMRVHGLRTFKSEYPNIDIRHKDNFSHFVRKEEQLTDEVPGWGITLGRFHELL